MESKNNPKKTDQITDPENTEQFIKEMMEQRKLQQDALNKIINFMDHSEERTTPTEPETEEKKLLQRIFKNRK